MADDLNTADLNRFGGNVDNTVATKSQKKTWVTVAWIVGVGVIVAAVVGVGAAVCVGFVKRKNDPCKNKDKDKDKKEDTSFSDTKGKGIDLTKGSQPVSPKPDQQPKPMVSSSGSEKPYLDENEDEVNTGFAGSWMGTKNKPVDFSKVGGSRESEAQEALKQLDQEEQYPTRRKDTLRGKDIDNIDREEVTINRKMVDVMGEISAGHTCYIMMHMTDCTHCKDAMPHFIEVARRAKGQGKRAYMVNENTCSKEFLDDHQIDGFPTFFTISSSSYKVYEGERNVSGFLTFMGISNQDMMGRDQRNEPPSETKKKHKKKKQ